jgi:hypothetical protein
MLILSPPVTQERFNATVKEVIGLNILGSVLIPPPPSGTYETNKWDPGALIDYLEHALRIAVIPTLEEDGSTFLVWGKRVEFIEKGVLISREVCAGSGVGYGRVCMDDDMVALIAAAEA